MSMEDRRRKSEDVGFQKEAKYKQEGEGGEEIEEDRKDLGGRGEEDEMMNINLVAASEFLGLWAQNEEREIQGWKKVTDAVHANGGKMFAQLWHVGRVAHPHFFGGDVLAVFGDGLLVAPSCARRLSPQTD